MEDCSGTKKYFERVNRLFNKKYFCYEGIIHEQIVSMQGSDYETENIDITVEHIGYTKEALNKTNKLNRNIDLLDKAISVNPNDPYLYYQLGKSYYMLKDYNKSSSFFEKALNYDLNYNLEYVEDLIETYGYSLINNGRYSEALELEKLKEYYNNADFYFLMGLVYMNNAKFTLAVENFLECTNFKYSKVKGNNSYLSYYNVGVIYEVLGFKKQAVEYYEKCGDYELSTLRVKALNS